MYVGGGTKARICPTTWTDSKWRPVPSKRDGCLIPNLIGNQKWKENLLQNTRLGATTECIATFKHSPNEPARLARQWMKERGIIVCTLSVGFIYLVVKC